MNISLTTPIALLGLLTLPVILALHMLRSRSRIYPVSSLTLWRFLNPQLSGSAARRIPLSWLLIIDLLIAALLSLALAGPTLDLTREVREGRHLVLILDTSTSMAAEDVSNSRLQEARADLMALASGAFENDAITIIGFSATAWTLADSRSLDFSQQLSSISEIQAGGTGANLSAALALARASIDTELPGEVHIFTDAAYPEDGFSTAELPIEWHLYGTSSNNLAVLDVGAVRLSDLKYQVFARVANYSTEAAQRTLSLIRNGETISNVNINIEPENSLTHTWEIIGNAKDILVTIGAGDDHPVDDSAFTVLEAAPGSESESIDIALVTEQPAALLSALEAVPGTNIQVVKPDEYLPGSPFDLVFFQRYLPERWPGNLAVVVDAPTESKLLGTISDQLISGIPFPAPNDLLADVDFTGVRWETARVPDKIPEGIAPILSDGSTPLILQGESGLTQIILILVETNDENGTPGALTRHPAFPLLVANIVDAAKSIQVPAKIAAGSKIRLPDANRYPELSIILPNKDEMVFENNRPIYWSGTLQPGFYILEATHFDGDELSFLFGVNAGDYLESDITPQGWPDNISSPAPPSATTERPLSLVPYLMAAVILLLLLEAWLAWR